MLLPLLLMLLLLLVVVLVVVVVLVLIRPDGRAWPRAKSTLKVASNICFNATAPATSSSGNNPRRSGAKPYIMLLPRPTLLK